MNAVSVQKSIEEQYLDTLRDILASGEERPDRTEVGTLNLFGRSLTHNYDQGFPLLTTKKMFVKGILGELLWFLKGTEDPSYLIENRIKIWDAWMIETKEGPRLPHTYGVKWRNFGGVDQISALIEEIQKNPYSRRHLVSAWDPRHIQDAALPWCHVLFQCDVMLDEDKPPDKRPNDGFKGDVSIAVFQRSADFFFLGVPFNIASYSFLIHMIAKVCGLRPRALHYTFGNCHLYKNHLDQARTQISRIPYSLPTLDLPKKDSIDEYLLTDFGIVGYESHGKLTGEVAI